MPANGTYGLEVKTASAIFPKRGGDPIFQHEGFQKSRNYDAVVLVDIRPDDRYLAVAPKSTLPFTRIEQEVDVRAEEDAPPAERKAIKMDPALSRCAGAAGGDAGGCATDVCAGAGGAAMLGWRVDAGRGVWQFWARRITVGFVAAASVPPDREGGFAACRNWLRAHSGRWTTANISRERHSV